MKEKTIKSLAAERGYTARFHDGLCDLVPLERGLLPWHNAPMEDALEYLLHPVNEPGLQAAWEGLNLDRFDVVGRFDGPRGAVLLMHAGDGKPLSWSVQYAASGQYFHDLGSAAVYIAACFGRKTLSTKKYSALMAACGRHRESGLALRELL